MLHSRTITGHEVNPANEAIKITADERTHGNASHEYFLTFMIHAIGYCTRIAFQKGPIKEAGVNGVTNEALLAILIDRFEGFQAGPYACEENAEALRHLLEARTAMFRRTQNRELRGVEGTHEV